MATARLCAVCGCKPALTVCCCSALGLLLCAECLGAHSARRPLAIHTLLPPSALASLTLPGYFPRLKQRRESLLKARSELEANLSRVDSCQALFTQHIQATIESLLQYQDVTSALLQRYRQQLRAEITQAEKEAAEHLFDDKYEAKHPLAAGLLDYKPGKLTVFGFELSEDGRLRPKLGLISPLIEEKRSNLASTQPSSRPISPLPSLRLPLIAHRSASFLPKSVPRHSNPFILPISKGKIPAKEAENGLLASLQPPKSPPASSLSAPRSSKEGDCRPLAALSLPGPESMPIPYKIGKRSISIARFQGDTRLYDLALPSNCAFSAYSAAIYMPTSTLVLLGGHQPLTAQALSLNIQSGHAKELRNMLEKRFAPGCLFHQSAIYVFGGSNEGGNMRLCERFLRKEKVWEQLPPMQHARSFFSPCLDAGLLYLIGGCKECTCESFDPKTLKYSQLRLKVPIPGPTLALKLNSDLLILQSGSVTRLQGSLTGPTEHFSISLQSIWCNSAPLLSSSTLLLGQCEDASIQSLNTDDWTSITYR